MRRLLDVKAQMENSSQVKGSVLKMRKWIVGIAGKFVGGEYWKLLASHLKDSI